jgi:hypothetical protein
MPIEIAPISAIINVINLERFIVYSPFVIKAAKKILAAGGYKQS